MLGPTMGKVMILNWALEQDGELLMTISCGKGSPRRAPPYYWHWGDRGLGFFVVNGHCYALHKYRCWYWVLVSLEANFIGYWILGAFLGIVLTLLLVLY